MAEVGTIPPGETKVLPPFEVEGTRIRDPFFTEDWVSDPEQGGRYIPSYTYSTGGVVGAPATPVSRAPTSSADIRSRRENLSDDERKQLDSEEIDARIRQAGGYERLSGDRIKAIIDDYYYDIYGRTPFGGANRPSNASIFGSGQGPPLVIPTGLSPLQALIGTVILNRGNLENIFGGGIPDPTKVATNVGGIITNPVGTVIETGKNLGDDIANLNIGGGGTTIGGGAPSSSTSSGRSSGVGTIPPKPAQGDWELAVNSDGEYIWSPRGPGGVSSSNPVGSGTPAPAPKDGDVSADGKWIVIGGVWKPNTPLGQATGGVSGPNQQPSNSGSVVLLPGTSGASRSSTGGGDTSSASGGSTVLAPGANSTSGASSSTGGGGGVGVGETTTPGGTILIPTGGGGGGSTTTGTNVSTALTGTYNFVLPQPNQLIMRDFGKEGTTSLEALKGLREPIVGMYKELYNAFSPTSLTGPAGTGYEPTAISRLNRDLTALEAAERRELSAEDIRNAQQAAREAAAARGQVFAPGAVGAEILGRDTLARQREAEARANYQQSMQNVANAVQLKTGNLFAPIANLMQGTFNPYSQYANQVYDYNVNAYNEYQAAKENLAAYKEAAARGQEAQFLNAFGNFLTKNGIQTTQKQLGELFQGLMDIFGGKP